MYLMIGGVLEIIQHVKWWDLGLNLVRVISKFIFLIITQRSPLQSGLLGVQRMPNKLNTVT